MGRSTPRRADSAANRQRLIDATGSLLAGGEPPRSLQQVAAHAGLAAATAYRHFSSLEDVLQAFAHQTVVGMQTRLTETSANDGVERLRCLSREWIRVIRERGPAMVHLRSARGFLERRRAGEMVIADTCVYLEPAVVDAMSELGAPAESLDYALFLWNILFDPREVLDLVETLGWTDAQIVGRLFDTYVAGLRGAVVDGAKTPRPSRR